MDPASIPLKKNRNTASHESFSRFSEKSIHSNYSAKQGARCCDDDPCRAGFIYLFLFRFLLEMSHEDPVRDPLRNRHVSRLGGCLLRNDAPGSHPDRANAR